MEENLRLRIDWTSLIVRSKFTVFALFYFVFENNFPSTSPRRAYIWRGDLTEGFLRYRFGRLIFGGAYTWKSLFSEFYGSGNLLIGQVPFFPRSPDDVYPPVREEEQDDYLLSNLDMDISTSVIPPVSHAYYHLSRSRNP